jgi:hypothetical protein
MEVTRNIHNFDPDRRKGNIKMDNGKICCGYMNWCLDRKRLEA